MITSWNLVQLRHQAQFGRGWFFQEPVELASDIQVHKGRQGLVTGAETVTGNRSRMECLMPERYGYWSHGGILRTMRKNWAGGSAERQVPLLKNRTKLSGSSSENWNPI